MDYHNLPRKQLQALCKKHEIPANQTNVQMADALAALLKVDTKPKSGAVQKQAAAEEDVRDESSVLTENSNIPKVKATRSKRQETKDVEEEDCEQFVASAEDDEGDSEEKTANKRARGSRKLRSKSQKDDKDEVVVLEEVEKPRTRGARGEKTGKVTEPDIRGVEKLAAKKTDNANKKNASVDDNCDEVARAHSEVEQGFKREATLQGKENRSRQLKQLPKKAESIEQREHKVTDVSGVEEDDEVDVVEEAVKPRHRGSRSERAGKGTVPDISGLEEVRKKVDTKKKNVSELDIAKDCREGEQRLKDDAALQSKDNGGRQLRHSKKKLASVEESENKVLNIAQTEKDVQEEIVMKVDKKKNKENASEGANVHEKADDHNECEQGLKGEAASQGKFNDGRQTRHLRRKPESDNESVEKMVDAAEPEVRVPSKRTTRANASKITQNNRPAITSKAVSKALDEEEEINGNTSESSCKNKTSNVQKLEKSPVVIDLVDSDDDGNLEEKEDMSEQSKIFVHSKNGYTKKAEKGIGKMMPCQKTSRARQSKVSVEIHANISDAHKHVMSSRGHKGGEKDEVLVNGCTKGRNESEATVNPSTSVKQVITRRRGKGGHKEELVNPRSVEDKVEAVGVSDETTLAEHKETLITCAEEQKGEAVAVSVESAVNHIITRRGRKGCQESHATTSNKELKNNATDIYVENIVDASESSKKVVTRRLHKSGHIMQEVVNVNKLDRVDLRGCYGGLKEENVVNISSEENKFDAVEEAKNKKTHTVDASESPKQVVTRRGRRGVHNEDEAVNNVNNVGCRGRNGRKKEEVNASAQVDKDVAADVNSSAQPIVNPSDFTKQVETKRGRRGGRKEFLVNTSLVEEKNNGADHSVKESVNSTIEEDMTNVAQKISSCEANESCEDITITDSRKLESKKDGSKSKTRTQRRQQLAKDLMSPDNANMMEGDKKRQQTISDTTCPSMRAITSRQEQRKTRGAISEIPKTRHKINLETVNKSENKKGHQSYSKDHTEEGSEEKEHDAKKHVTFQCKEGFTEVFYPSEEKQVKQSCQKTMASHWNTKMKGTKAVKFSTDNIDTEFTSKRDTEEITCGQLDAECVVEKETEICGDAEEGLGVPSNLIGKVYSNSDEDVLDGICVSMLLEESLEKCQVTELSETMNTNGSEFVVAVESNINEERENRKLVDIKEEEENTIKDEKIGDEKVISTVDNVAFQTVKDVNGDDMVEDGHSERELGDKFVSQGRTVEVSEIEEIGDGESLMGEHRDFENDNLGEFFDPVEKESEPMEEESDPSCEFGEDEESDVEQKISDLDSWPQSDDLLLNGHESEHISSETDNDDEDSSESYEEDCDSDPSEEIGHEESVEFPFTNWQNDRLSLRNEAGTNKLNCYDIAKDPEEENAVTVSNASRQLEGCTLVSGGFQDDSAPKDEADGHNVKGSSSCEEGNFNEKHSNFHVDEEICHKKNSEILLAGLQSDKYSSEDETDDDKSSHSDSSNGSDIEKEFPVLHPFQKNDNLINEVEHNDDDLRKTQSSDSFLSEDNVFVFNEVQNDSAVKDKYYEHEPRCSSCNEEDEELYYSESEEFEHEEKMDALDTGMPNDGIVLEDEADKFMLGDSGISIDSDNEKALLAGKQIEDKTREEARGIIYDKSHGHTQNDSDVREEVYAEASDESESQIQQPSKTMDFGALLTEEDEMVETTTEIRTSHVEMYDLFRNISSDNMLRDIIPEVGDQNKKISDLLDSNVSSFADIYREKIGDTDSIDEQHTCISAPDELPGKEENEAEQSETCTKNGNTTEVGSVYSGDLNKELTKVEENAVETSCFDLKIKFDEPGSYESHDPGKVKYCEVEGDTNVILFSGLNDDSPNNQEIQEEFSSSTVVGEVQLAEKNSISVDEIRSISTEKINEFGNCTKILHCSAMNDSAIEQSPKILSTELVISRCDSLLKMSYRSEGNNWSPCLNSLFVDEFVTTSEKVELELSESKDTNPCSDMNEPAVEDCQDTLSTEACKLEFRTLKDPELSSDTEVFLCSDGSAMEQSEEEVLPTKHSLEGSSELDTECSGTDDSAVEAREEVFPTETCKLKFHELDSERSDVGSINAHRQEIVVTETCKQELIRLDSPCSDMDVAATEERQQVILLQPCKHELSQSDTPLKMSEIPKGYDMTPCLNSSYDITQMQPGLKSNANVSACSGMDNYAIEKSEEVSPKQPSKLDFSQIDSPSKISYYTEGYEISPSLNTLCSLLKKLELGSRTDVPTFSGVDDSVIEQNREVLPTDACNLELPEFSTTSGMTKLTKDHDVSPPLKITNDVLFFSGIIDSTVKQRQEVSPADVSNQELSPSGTTLMMTESPKSYEISPCLNTLFVEESDTTIRIHEPKTVIDSLIGKQEHFVATEVYEPSEIHEMPPSEILESSNDTDSLIQQSQEVVAPEIDIPMKMPELIKGCEKSPCLSTLFVEEFGSSYKMGDPTNQNNSVNEKSQTVFPIEQKISPCLNFQPTKIKMAELTTELEMSPCLNTLFAEMSSTPSKMPEPISSIDISSTSSAVDDSSLLQMNQILPTEACKHEISQISPHSNSAFEQNSGTPMGKPELDGNNNLFDCAGMFDASEQSIEIIATEDPKEDAYEQERSKIDTQAKVAEFTKEFEMSPCLNTLFAEVFSTPSKMPEPTSCIEMAPSLGVDDSSLLEMNEILPTEASKHEISHISPHFEQSFGNSMEEPDLAGNNNLFDCVGVNDSAEQSIEILKTEASKQEACEQERSIFDTQMKMAKPAKEFEMSPCLNTLFAEVSSADLSSPCLGMDDSSLQDLNEILVAEACKCEIYQISPRSNATFEQISGTSMEIFSTEASGQDHYELDSPMKKGHPTEGRELSACLSISSGQDSNSSKKTSEMDKDLDYIQEPSQVNISSEKPQLAEGFGKLEQYTTPLKTVELTERSDVLQRSIVAGVMETEIQFMDERESEQSLLPEISADHVQYADGDTCSGNVTAAGKESKPTSRIMERLANLNNRLQGMQKGLEGHLPTSYCTPARKLKPSKGSASAKRVRETMSVSRSRLPVKGDKEAFMKENPNDFTQHSFQQLKSLAKEKDFEKSVTKRAALQNLSSNALEQRIDSVGKPFPSDERTSTIHENQCS